MGSGFPQKPGSISLPHRGCSLVVERLILEETACLIDSSKMSMIVVQGLLLTLREKGQHIAKNVSHFRELASKRVMLPGDHFQHLKPEEAGHASRETDGKFSRREQRKVKQVTHAGNIEHEAQEEERAAYDPP